MLFLFRLSIRLLLRDWRSGELNILGLALIIALACITTNALFSDRLHRTMTMQAAAFLAADLVVTGHSPIPEKWLDQARDRQLKTARSSEFSSVILHRESLLLCGIKAVDDAYPLRGRMKTSFGAGLQETDTTEIPDSGSAWVEQRVLTGLGLEVGDSIEIGEKPLKISRILTYEPDRRGNLLGLTPRIVMNRNDLAATRVIQPGSHIHYYFLFAGAESGVIEFKRWLKQRLGPAHRIMDVYEDRPELGSAYQRAEKYLGLASIVVVLISGVAIAVAARRYSRRHFDMTAICRCLGVRQNQILWLFTCQLLLLGLITSLVGCLIGWTIQESLVWYLHNLLPEALLEPGWKGYALAVLSALVILAGFALSPLLQQRQVSPLMLLRRDLIPLPAQQGLVYGTGFLAILLLIFWYTKDLRLSLYFLGGVAALISICGTLIYAILRLSRRLLPYLSLNSRFGIQQLSRNGMLNLSQVLAFSITFTAMIVIFWVRTDLIVLWQQKLPVNAPNYFALNIFPDEWQKMRDWLGSRDIDASAFYPIVRGRLTRINDSEAEHGVASDSRAERVLNRDLNLTYSETLPADNRIQSGSWWTGETGVQVSIEQGLAESLGTKIGDSMTFRIGSEDLVATVSSIRSVRWDTMKPNFFVIFAPGALNKFPTTYMTSFYLPEQKKLALNGMVKEFPNVSVLGVDLIIRQIQLILTQVTFAVEYVLVFALMAGMIVLFAAVYSSIDERILNSCIFRTLGAGRRLILQNQCVEFASLGFLAGLLGAISAELLLWVLYQRIFELPYHLNWKIEFFTPIAGAFLIALFGLWSTRKVVNHSPLRLIRDN